MTLLNLDARRAEGTTMIQSLRSNTSQATALRRLEGGVAGRWVRALRVGPVRSMAQVYLPFRLHRVHVDTGRRAGGRTMLLGIDLVQGTLDLYGFDALPPDEEILPVQTRNRAPERLSPGEAERLLRARVERMVLRGGVFRMRRMEIAIEPAGLDFHVPYWVAFSGRGTGVHLEVMDAVRGCIEGEKVRACIREWLASAHGDRGSADLTD